MFCLTLSIASLRSRASYACLRGNGGLAMVHGVFSARSAEVFGICHWIFFNLGMRLGLTRGLGKWLRQVRRLGGSREVPMSRFDGSRQEGKGGFVLTETEELLGADCAYKSKNKTSRLAAHFLLPVKRPKRFQEGTVVGWIRLNYVLQTRVRQCH